MNILELIRENAKKSPNAIAIENKEEKLTYKELWDKSDLLANFIVEKLGDDKKPIVVYGHKNPFMIVCFLACVKSGRAYCPLDISMPKVRILDIIETVESDFVLGTETNHLGIKNYIDIDEIKAITDLGKSKPKLDIYDESIWVKNKETYYIIFTSGSTGKPKGVEISLDNLSNFVEWSMDLIRDSKSGNLLKQITFLNQAPFSFDLSVMDLYTCLGMGGRLYAVNKDLQKDAASLVESLDRGEINVWVSTPSFAEMTMANKEFSEERFHSIKTFLFCGEKFGKDTAARLAELFPNASIYNTYGPTESTVAVTSVKLDNSHYTAEGDLPIGKCKPGTELYIIKEDGSIGLEGERGELIITGDTVSKGYFHDPQKTEEVFIADEISSFKGAGAKAYRTGDEGYFVNGMFYCSGRMDLQIKLHGYRIELGDIESNLTFLAEVSQACVVPRRVDGKIRSLVAFVVESEEAKKMEYTADEAGEPLSKARQDFAKRKAIREKLKSKLPDYMVPKKVIFIESMPMTANGKIDRKKLEAMV